MKFAGITKLLTGMFVDQNFSWLIGMALAIIVCSSDEPFALTETNQTPSLNVLHVSETIAESKDALSESSNTLRFPTEEGEFYQSDSNISTKDSDKSIYTLTTSLDRKVKVEKIDIDMSQGISVHPVHKFIIEGSSAIFMVSSPITQTEDLTINYTVTQSGDVLTNSKFFRTVLLPAGFKSVNIYLPTVNDYVKEDRGTITVMLAIDTSPVKYTVTSMATYQSASVTVIDNDVQPVYSIFDVSVNEGSPPQFNVSSLPSLFTNLTIRYTVSQTRDFYTNYTYSRTHSFSALHSPFTTNVASVDNKLDEKVEVIYLTANQCNYSQNSQLKVGSTSCSIGLYHSGCCFLNRNISNTVHSITPHRSIFGFGHTIRPDANGYCPHKHQHQQYFRISRLI